MSTDSILAARDVWRADVERARYSRAEFEAQVSYEYMRGVSQAEIARMLGVSDEAVRKMRVNVSMRTADDGEAR